jgi:glucose/arabinose dehydrogenase
VQASRAQWAAVVIAVAAGLALSGCAVTQTATSVTESGATLGGVVHPQGAPTTWWFEYGPTTAYGSETAHEDAGSGAGWVPVSKRVTGLAAGTTYHFRACEIGGTRSRHCGEDRTFTTASGRLQPGFTETVAFSGLTAPTTFRFAADGRVFVAEKSGLIKVFDGLGDTSASVFADLRTQVHNFWDRGLLGLALDPDFPADPFVYVLYTHDAAIGATAPRWGSPGVSSDSCPNPPGATADGCLVSGRLARLVADGDVQAGPEQVLVEDWCQQFPSHSVGALAFGPDGSLYASGGDGASFNYVDYGQTGNPCGDPPGDAGTALAPPGAEGGALRSQDLRSTGDPAGLDGTVIRVDPETGEGLPGNPGAGSADRNVRRVVGYGLRNPFRITVRPGTGEVWLGDVGWGAVEEIDRLASPTDGTADNFGWPCFEGPARLGVYDGAQLDLCESLYTSGEHVAPFFSYRHDAHVASGETCSVGGSSTAGVAFGFYGGGPYPPQYDGALFFADYSRDCIWVMRRGGGTLPSASALTTFVQGAANPVDLQVGPNGELFYADLDGGTIRRITYAAGNQPPVAVAGADRTAGSVPLTVAFDGSSSDDPDSASPLSFAWDLDGDGQHDDSTSARPSFTYTVAGTYTAELRVTDAAGASTTDAVTITAGNTPPTAVIAAPGPGVRWAVGDGVEFSGAAVDDQDGTLPPAALSWQLVLQHCPAGCHNHPVQSWPGVATGSFVTPDHEYPSHLELRLTATDSGGLQDTQTVRLDPRTAEVTLRSSPPGLTLSLGPHSATADFTRTVIAGSRSTISAPSPQTLGGGTYVFGGWSDGGARTHDVVVADDAEYTATFGPG